MAFASKAATEGGPQATPLALTARAAALTALAAMGWVLMEWLFFVTKPSFISVYSALESFGILAGTTAIASLVLVLFAAPFILAGGLAARFRAPPRWAFALQCGLAVVALAVLGVVAFDNFTLTLFGFGIRDAAGAVTWLYRGVCVLAVYLAARGLYAAWRGTTRLPRWVAGLLVLACIGSLAMPRATAPEGVNRDAAVAGGAAELPNIIVVSGDGIAADHMSLYGYERKTTPFLDGIADELLIANYSFTNAADTGGSIVSMLTGRLPTTTRVIFPPDVLHGEAAWQHLPGLLKGMGYYTADISLRHYADAWDLNVQGGFDESTLRRVAAGTGGLLLGTLRGFPVLNPVSMFLERMGERAQERYGHVWKGEAMPNPKAEVNEPDLQWLRDPQRIQALQRIIDEESAPFFVHMHLLAAHGPRFRPRERRWSSDEDYESTWNMDGYDDAVADFDRYLADIHAALSTAGLLENTILVVTSDHGVRHRVRQTLPLLLRLPGRLHAGRLNGVTQRIDIAPTLLDLLGAPVPDWMEGRSLLDAGAGSDLLRPVFATRVKAEKEAEEIWWSAVNLRPPWYALGYVYLVRCNQGFELRLTDMRLDELVIERVPACGERLDQAAARELLLAHLYEKGYRWENSP